jgi:hypothetical protein
MVAKIIYDVRKWLPKRVDVAVHPVGLEVPTAEVVAGIDKVWLGVWSSVAQEHVVRAPCHTCRSSGAKGQCLSVQAS